VEKIMASTTNATPQNERVPKEDSSEVPSDSPLLDLSDAGVKKLIQSAKKRGYVTVDAAEEAGSSAQDEGSCRR
jgi:RNA polymerase primary sigma factor